MNSMERLERELDGRIDQCSSCVVEIIERYDCRWKRCVDCGHVEEL